MKLIVNFYLGEKILNGIESEPWHYKPCAKLEIAIFYFKL
jgi:hypothetical protein